MHLQEPITPSPEGPTTTTTKTTIIDEKNTPTEITIKSDLHDNTTSTTPRPLYFAYGSNLSFTQMKIRCTYNPALSANPVAIARLDQWRWLICEAGYANVIPPASLRVGKQDTDGEKVPVSGDDDAIYGVLYEMAPEDELLLDGYEDVDHKAGPAKSGGKVPVSIRPTEQGEGDYNKWYLPATVTEWLDEGQRGRRGDVSEQTVLVYVDEERVQVGLPREEYVPRMNRAIREAEELGFPKDWADEVMWKYIPKI
ncbi:hypothetical protein ASPWEDRAFT_29503 [Aspergillus wentii DTO 134E9]|uniref:gamma-glutamylcyclotransferase n=1 Tax=Aspergillus wentii DTO 134E9 TaxID=1073089 RepID=A0A1L9RHD9_ASPWE|nr:uncharacterized protein ASPWEDRAFT_29503 [Aspergillus wentii DTO 134E9]KAI9925680.1 hypothetical protein MW887_005482 [Aspergillus wentii]OJJ34345.1 hypothetical protein ASPWEDRAFT_29503 [Aspergillus wentii DTO 134E9]